MQIVQKCFLWYCTYLHKSRRQIYSDNLYNKMKFVIHYYKIGFHICCIIAIISCEELPFTIKAESLWSLSRLEGSNDDWMCSKIFLDRFPYHSIPPKKESNSYSQHKHRRALGHSGPTHWHEILSALQESQVHSHSDAFPSQPALELAGVTCPAQQTSWGAFLL